MDGAFCCEAIAIFISITSARQENTSSLQLSMILLDHTCKNSDKFAIQPRFSPNWHQECFILKNLLAQREVKIIILLNKKIQSAPNPLVFHVGYWIVSYTSLNCAHNSSENTKESSHKCVLCFPIPKIWIF